MKPSRQSILIVAAVIIFIAGAFSFWPGSQTHRAQVHGKDIYYCPMHPTYTSDKPGHCPICQMKLVKREATPESVQEKSASSPTQNTAKKILYWTDPMIPGYKASGPGKSPMGMDLIPVYQQDKTARAVTVAGHAPVSLNLAKQQLIGVKTEKVSTHPLIKTIHAVGTVAHDTDLYQAQAEYLQAIASLKNARSSGSAEIIEQSQAIVDAIRLRLIHMGFHEGLMEELKLRNSPDQSLLISETGPVWVYAYIYQYEVPYVDVGTPVKVEVPSLAQETFEGAVRGVDPMVDATTRTVRIRIQIKNAKGVLKPDMYVNVRMDVNLGEVIAVPQEAVFHTGERDIVFVESEHGVFQPRQVTLGTEAQGFYEIKSGLKKDEMVATSGNFLIDSESRLKASIEGASDAGE